jgi:hypothetical protein
MPAPDPLSVLDDAIKSTRAELKKLELAQSVLKDDAGNGTGRRGNRRHKTRAKQRKAQPAPQVKQPRKTREVTIPEKTDRNGVTRKAHVRHVPIGPLS